MDTLTREAIHYVTCCQRNLCTLQSAAALHRPLVFYCELIRGSVFGTFGRTLTEFLIHFLWSTLPGDSCRRIQHTKQRLERVLKTWVYSTSISQKWLQSCINCPNEVLRDFYYVCGLEQMDQCVTGMLFSNGTLRYLKMLHCHWTSFFFRDVSVEFGARRGHRHEAGWYLADATWVSLWFRAFGLHVLASVIMQRLSYYQER